MARSPIYKRNRSRDTSLQHLTHKQLTVFCSLSISFAREETISDVACQLGQGEPGEQKCLENRPIRQRLHKQPIYRDRKILPNLLVLRAMLAYVQR